MLLGSLDGDQHQVRKFQTACLQDAVENPIGGTMLGEAIREDALHLTLETVTYHMNQSLLSQRTDCQFLRMVLQNFFRSRAQLGKVCAN